MEYDQAIQLSVESRYTRRMMTADLCLFASGSISYAQPDRYRRMTYSTN